MFEVGAVETCFTISPASFSTEMRIVYGYGLSVGVIVGVQVTVNVYVNVGVAV